MRLHINAWNHQRTIICIQNRLLFCFIGAVNDLDTIACPSVSCLGAIAMEFGMDIIVTYGSFSIIFILVITDVVGDNGCCRFGLWPLRTVAVSVCGGSCLWPFWFVAVPVCGRSCLWPFRFVAVPVCGRSGLWPFSFVAVLVVAVSVCGRYDLLLTGLYQSNTTYLLSVYPPPTKFSGVILASIGSSVCLVRPSICGWNRVWSISSPILAGSISHLHILSINFRWVTYWFFF